MGHCAHDFHSVLSLSEVLDMRALQIFGELLMGGGALALLISLLVVAGKPTPRRIGTTDDPMYSDEERDKWR